MNKRSFSFSLILITLSLIFTGCKANEAVDYSSDDISMPKGFESLPQNNGEEDLEHISIVIPESKCASTIYVVNPENCTGLTGEKGLSQNEILLLTSLQGIVAQEQAEIYIGKTSDKWIKYVAKEYDIELEKRENLKELIENYKDRLNGYVKAVWKADNTHNSQINQASSISGAEQLLIMAVGNKERDSQFMKELEEIGLECKYDLTSDEYTESGIINDNIDKLNKDILILQVPSKSLLRDFGISEQAPFYFYNMGVDEDTTENILYSFNPLAIAFGWEEITVNNKLIGEIEDLTVERLAKHNMGLVPADFCENLSLWYSLPREKFQQKEQYRYAESDENGQYHYATLLYSDGDNIQCWQGGPFDKERFAYPNKENLSIGWTATPILLETMPMVMKYLYQNMTDREEFVCSISGYNFTKLSEYNKNVMQAYVKKTARLMKDADMRCIALKDEAEEIKPVWDEFAKYDSVDGGFFMYGKYHDAAGNIYWANNKPIVYDREILWEREDSQQSIEENPAKVAVKLNHYAKDKTSADGYTFIQVHCWSYTYSDLYNLFYQNLDLNQVKIVTPSEFISLISENVPHENGKTMVNDNVVDSLTREFIGPDGYFITEAYPMWNRLDDYDGKINYTGDWTISENDIGLNRTSHTTGNKGDTAEITFTGTEFKVFINTKREGGYFNIYIDGKLAEKDLSCYGRALTGFNEAFSYNGLKEGEHTVVIKVMGRKEKESLGTDVCIDGFYYK